jgi:uncharacterized membrane protein YtjA (UPF0391 family)
MSMARYATVLLVLVISAGVLSLAGLVVEDSSIARIPLAFFVIGAPIVFFLGRSDQSHH